MLQPSAVVRAEPLSEDPKGTRWVTLLTEPPNIASAVEGKVDVGSLSDNALHPNGLVLRQTTVVCTYTVLFSFVRN